MNKLLYIILSIGVGIALLGCDSENIRKAASDEDNAPAVTHTPGTDIDTELPDSLLTRDHIQEYTFSDTVKAARIINAMRRRGLASAYVLDVAQGDLLFNNGRYKAALSYYERALRSDSARTDDNEQMEMIHRLVSCYDCLHDEPMKARYVERLLRKAEACGSKPMQSIALFNMGKMAYYQESKERGYELIAGAIRLMEESDYKYKFDNLRYNYNSLFIMQQRDKRYGESLATLDRLEAVVKASTEREPEIKDLNEKELKTLYANRAVALLRLGRDREADDAYRLWKSCDIAYTKDDYLVAPYLADRGLYDEVIRIYAGREAFLRANKDTINYHVMTIKRALGNAYLAKGDYRKAAGYFRQLAAVTDSLKVREQHSAALKLAEVYKTNEQASQLKAHESTIRIRTVISLFTALLLVVAIIFIIRILRHKRVIQRKNDAMTGTIDELMDYKSELFLRQEEVIRLRDELRRYRDAERRQPSDTHMAEQARPAIPAVTDLTEKDRALFDRVSHEIISRKLYLRPGFNKSELMKEIHVPANKFAALFKEFAGCNFSQYMKDRQMDYAIHLMREHPQWNMESIAKEAQMSKATFYRQFQEKYGMNPTNYIKRELFTLGEQSQ